MLKIKRTLINFFSENGALLSAATGLIFFIFIPILGLIITFYALSIAIIIFKTYQKRKGDITFTVVALTFELIALVTNTIINLQLLEQI